MDAPTPAVWIEHAASEKECQKLRTWQAEYRCAAGVLKPGTAEALKAQHIFCERANRGISEDESLKKFILRADVNINGQVYRFECEEKKDVTHK